MYVRTIRRSGARQQEIGGVYMSVLVTGASGYIGQALTARLQRQALAPVLVSRRGGAARGGPAMHAVDFATGNLDESLLQGVSTVYHLAGIAHTQAPDAQYAAVNCRATLALADAAERAGVHHFIFVSSVKAMGPPATAMPRRETEVSAPADAYGRSKWKAECALRERFHRSAMTVSILRPALVYGPAPKGNLKWLLRAARFGVPVPPEGGARSMIGLDDLVELLLLLPGTGLSGVNTFNVADGRAYSTRETYQLLRAALGKQGPGVASPAWLWRVLASLLDLVQRQAPGSSFDKLFGAERYDNHALLQATGWVPRDTLATVAPAMACAGEGPP